MYPKESSQTEFPQIIRNNPVPTGWVHRSLGAVLTLLVCAFVPTSAPARAVALDPAPQAGFVVYQSESGDGEEAPEPEPEPEPIIEEDPDC